LNAIQVAMGIIENDHGELLLAQRPPGSRLAGQWEFPGGKLEAGETGEQALHRELYEELNLKVHILANLGSYPFTYEWGSIVLQAFRVSALNTPAPTDAVQVFRWVKPSDLEVTQLSAADREPFYFYQRSLSST